jgi:DNA polymerase III delta prime subunit
LAFDSKPLCNLNPLSSKDSSLASNDYFDYSEHKLSYFPRNYEELDENEPSTSAMAFKRPPYRATGILSDSPRVLKTPKLAISDYRMTLGNGHVIDIFAKRLPPNVDTPQEGKRSNQIYQILNTLPQPAMKKVEFKEDELWQETASLWVDKYRPKKFTELVSNDKDNLQVLQWLNQWKDICFPKKNKQKGKVLKASLLDDIEKKILLVSGPPGLGKTTLGHCVAALTGYHVLEVNASDDRTAAQLKEKIKTALSMNALDGRPHLILLDEIDGALGGSDSNSLISFLVQLANNSSEEESNSSSTKKKIFLTRPIICICNDAYSAALRPLRQVAEHVIMQPPSILQLQARIQEICSLESLNIDPRALLKLVQACQGDIRSCLTTLEFLHRKKSKFSSLKSAACLDMSFFEKGLDAFIGLKDDKRSYFQTMQDLFFMPKSSATGYSYGTAATIGRDSKVDRLIGLLSRQDAVLLDRVFDGAYEHFLSCHYYDFSMQKVSSLLSDWCFFRDRLQTATLKEPALSSQLYSYGQYTVAIFGQFFASSSNPPLPKSLPSQSFNAHSGLQSNREILESFLYYAACSQSISLSQCGNLLLDFNSVFTLRLDYMSPFLSIFESIQAAILKNSSCMKKCLTQGRLQYTTLLNEFPLIGKLLDFLLLNHLTLKKQQTNYQPPSVVSNRLQPSSFSIDPPIDKLLLKTQSNAACHHHREYPNLCQFMIRLVPTLNFIYYFTRISIYF